MAAPLSFPYGCRYKRGSMLGQRNEKSPSANVRAFADGDFFGAEGSVFSPFFDFSVKPIV